MPDRIDDGLGPVRSGNTDSPVAPTGLSQTGQAATGYATGDPTYAGSYLGQYATEEGWNAASQSWYTGANQRGIENGWNTDLINSFIPAWNSALEEGTAAQFFNDREATGVVTWDHEGVNGRTGEKEMRRFGDLMVNGRIVGNAYDDFDDFTADQIMGEFIFDADRKAFINSTSDIEGSYRTEVENERKVRTESFKDFAANVAFQEDVSERAEEFREGPVDEGIVGGSAVATGALTYGALAASRTPGPVWLRGAAALGGAAWGGGAAYLNRDALTEQAARAYEVTALSSETEGRIAGIMTGINQWAGFGAKTMTPLSNTVQGLNDVLAGSGGDGVSEFYKVDEQGRRQAPTWVRGLDVAATVGDSLLQFASPIGLTMYSAQMTGVIGGEVGELVATGGKTFDYRSASFDSIFTDDEGNFDFTQAAAGIGKVGIDAVQLGMARGLAGKVNALRADVSEAAAYGTLSRVLPYNLGGTRGLEAGESVVRAGGYRYIQAADGTIKEGSRRMTLGLLAPSEQLTALSTRVTAMRMTAKQSGALSADDFYRAAQALATGERKIQTVLVNAMGEGYEEGMQAVLEPHSHGHEIDWASVGEQALYGFAAGGGMGFGFALRTPNAADRMYSMASAAQLMRYGRELPRAEWDAMSETEQRSLSQLGKVELELLQSAYRKVSKDMAGDATAGYAGTAKIIDAMESELARRLRTGNNRMDGAYVITQTESVQTDADGNLLPGSVPVDAAVGSGFQIAKLLTDHLAGIGTQVTSLKADIAEVDERLGSAVDTEAADLGARRAALEAQLATAIRTSEWGARLNAIVEEFVTRAYAENRSIEQVSADTELFNDLLRKAFNLQLDDLHGEVLATQADKLALARAVSALVARDPHDQAGSYQMLVPQVSAKLTLANANDVLEVSHAILAAIRGDYDGDKVRPQNALILDDNEYAQARAGQHFVGAGTSVNVGAPKWEIHNVEAMAHALTSTDTVLASFATETMTSIGNAIRRRYEGVVDTEVLDEVLASFFAAVHAGSKDARKTLIDGLANKAGGPILEFAYGNYSNEWLWLDQLIVSGFQRFQEAYATQRRALPKEHSDSVPVAQAPAGSVRERHIEKSAVLGNTLGLLFEGDTPFRQDQKLHYAVLNAAVKSARDPSKRPDLETLALLYRQLGQAVTRAEIDEINAKDDITGRVLVQLTKMAMEAKKLLGSDFSDIEALGIVANIQVADLNIDVNGKHTVGRQPISLAQLLLKQSVAEDRREKDSIWDVSPELQAKHNRLLAMTGPGNAGEPGRSTNAQEAFIEVIGSMQLYTLLGEDALELSPHLTVEQWVRMYSSMHENDRRAKGQAIRDYPAYLEKKGIHDMPYTAEQARSGDISNYRAIVDAMLAVGNGRLGITTTSTGGSPAGTLSGTLARRSKGVSTEFHRAHAAMRKALVENFVPMTGGKLDAETVSRMVEGNPDFARALMALIPNAAANAVIYRRETDGELVIANWVFDMLLIKDAREAEMHYWRNILRAEWAAMGNPTTIEEDGDTNEIARRYDRLPRRMHRLLYTLNPSIRQDGGLAMERFLREMENATDLDEFIRWVNTEPGIRDQQTAPIVPWVDDVAEFDADKAAGGWTTALQGAELREAVTVLRKSSEMLVKDLVEERAAERADTDTLMAIERVIKADAGDATVELASGDRALYDAFVKRIDRAGELGIGLGPQAMVFQSILAVHGFYPQAHTKGKNPPHLEALGSFDAMRDAYGYVTNYERVMAALTATNLDAIGNSMGELARDDQRSMDENGNPIQWSKPTPAGMLELLRNSETRAMARSVLFPQVMERGNDGQLRPQLLTGKSLTELLNGTGNGELFGHHGHLSMDSALRYLSMVETVARKYNGHFSVQRAVNDIVIAKTSAADHVLSMAELEDMVLETYHQVARILQKSGALGHQPYQLDSDPLENLRTLVGKEQRKKRTAAVFGSLLRDGGEQIISGEQMLELMMDEMRDQATEDLDDLRAQLTASPERADEIEAQIVAIEHDLASAERRMKALMDDNLVQQTVETFTVDPAADDVAAKKDMLVKYVHSHLTLMDRASAVIPIVNKITQQLMDPDRALQVELTDDEWSQLSRAVVAVYLDDVVSFGGTSVAPFPEKPEDQKYYDSSFAYLADPFLDRAHPLVMAAIEVHRDSGRQGEDPTLESDVTTVLGDTIFKDFTYGDWTSDIPRASIEANQRIDSASAAAAIAIYGNSPKTQAVISAATRRTFDKPGDELLSRASLSWAEIDWSAFDDINATLPDGRQVTMPVAQLNNRFAKSVVVRYIDAEGNEQQVDVLASHRDVGRRWIADNSVADSGYVEIHNERIKVAVDKIAGKAGLPPERMFVDIEFFHPDTQPANWANNIYFEGTAFKLNGDRHESLNAALWFANESISPRGQATALDASKLGKPALRTTPVPTAAEVAALEEGWQSDLASVLRAKTRIIFESDLGGNELEADEFYNAVYKNLKLRHFVRGRVDGADVLWTAEQVIAHQVANPGAPLPIENPELWIPTDDVLRSMLGEQGTQGVARVFDDQLDIDLSKVPTWRGVTPEIMEQFPGILPDARNSIEKSSVVHRARQQQLVVRSQMSPKERNRHDARMLYLGELRNEIELQRSDSRKGGDGTFNPNVNLATALKGAAMFLQSENVAFDWAAAGIKFIGPRDYSNNMLSQLLIRDLHDQLAPNNYRTGWVFSEGAESHPATGLLSEVSLNKLKKHMRVSPGDIVVMQLDSFAGNADLAKKRAQWFADRGAIVVLGAADGTADVRAEVADYLMGPAQYSKIAGSKYVFQPTVRDSRYQNQRARVSTLMETRGVSQRSMIALFHGRGLPIQENAGWAREKDERLGAIAEQMNLVPTNAFAGFNVPATPEQIDLVTRQLRSLDDEEGRTFLRDMSNSKLKDRKQADADWNQAWSRLMARFDNYEGHVLPQPGEVFGTGDFIPLINQQGKILLYRHGMKAPRDRASIREMHNSGIGEPETALAKNVASYSGKRESAATTHTGTVLEVNPRSGYGLQIRLNIPLQHYGNKVQLEWNGMKYVIGPKPDGIELPANGFFDNWDISIISDQDSLFGKEAYDGLVVSHRNAFAYFGIDFTEDVTEFFFPGNRKDPDSQRKAQELLRLISRTVDKVPVEAADEMMKAASMTASFRDLLTTTATSAMGIADASWVDRLDSTDNAARITRAMLIYLTAAGSRVEDVLKSGGFNDTSTDIDAQSRLMPRLFTQAFDLTGLGDPLRLELNRRFNDQLGDGYSLEPDFTFVVKGPTKTMAGFLQFAEAHSSGDNPIKNGMSFDADGFQQVSQHTAAVAYQAIGAQTAILRGLDKARAFALGKGVPRFETEVGEKGVRQGKMTGGVWEMMTGIDPRDDSAGAVWRQRTSGELARVAVARDALVQFRQELDMTTKEWDTSDAGVDYRKEYTDLRTQILHHLGMKGSQARIVDFWIRQRLGSPAPRNGNEYDGVNPKAAIEAANDIWWNITRGYSPTLGAMVPLLHVHDLQMLWRAQQSRPEDQRWSLLEEIGGRKKAHTWNQWVQVSIGGALTSDTLFDPLFLLALDGFMHTYQNATSDLQDLPVSMDADLSKLLMDPETGTLLASLDPDINVQVSNPMVLDMARASLDTLISGSRTVGGYNPKDVPSSEIARKLAAIRKWRKENGVPIPIDMSLKDLRKNGKSFSEYSTNTNALTRMLINLRVGMALFNPALYVSMGPEQWVRGSLDRVAQIMTMQSTSTGSINMAQAEASQLLRRKAQDARVRLMNEPKDGMPLLRAMYAEMLSSPEDLGLTQRYTPDQIRKFDQLYARLGDSVPFKGMVYKDLVYLQQWVPGQRKMEKWLENFAKTGSRMQDPTHGMRAKTLARRYVEGALNHINALPTLHNITVDQLQAELMVNPNFLENNFPDAHQAGVNAIAQIRSLKQTTLSTMLRSIYEPATESTNGFTNFASNVLVKLPFIFANYAANVATTITGMQGLDQMIAMSVEGRKKPGLLLNAERAMRGERAKGDEVIDMSQVIEGIDLTRAFIRGGITHTGLFVTSMLAGSTGMFGEDDEARKRRLLAEHQGLGVIYDPRDIRNDFRNADAIYLDWLPYGSELTGGMTMVQPHWMLRQVISPMMGIEMFMRTGDIRNVQWGFEDALGAFPIINTMMWNDAVETGNMLADMADHEASKGGDTDIVSAAGFLTRYVMNYERMLFENSFLNALYVGYDRYDRDPYKLPLRDSDGDIQTDIEGNARPNDVALQPFVDEEGNVGFGYRDRDQASAYLHSLTENRGTLALVSSIFSKVTGVGEPDYFRYSMPIKLRTQEKEPRTQADAEALIISAYQAQQTGLIEGQEVAVGLDATEAEFIAKKIASERYDKTGYWTQADELASMTKQIMAQAGAPATSIVDKDGFEHVTLEGAKGIMKSLANGLPLSDESLRGVHIPMEMRDAIAKEWSEQIMQEGIDLGLDQTKATSRMKRIMWGPLSDPTIRGLGDILYAAPDKGGVSYTDKRVYKQLNTTYTIGPDGSYWATGFERDKLQGALGLSPLREQILPESAGTMLDERMNIVDMVHGANTGLRALEILDETEYIPTDKEIGDKIAKAIEDAAGQTYTPFTPYKSNSSGGGYYRRGGYGGGGYGGGGGYTYFTKMYALPSLLTAYGNNIPFVNTTNPIIRRADVRRERVWSERGRLKQWQ